MGVRDLSKIEIGINIEPIQHQHVIGATGTGKSTLLGSAVITRVWFTALSRNERFPVMLFMDELQLFSHLETLGSIISEGRKYGLGAVLAHQHTRQIPEAHLNDILGNAGIKVAFRVSGEDARIIARSFGGRGACRILRVETVKRVLWKLQHPGCCRCRKGCTKDTYMKKRFGDLLLEMMESGMLVRRNFILPGNLKDFCTEPEVFEKYNSMANMLISFRGLKIRRFYVLLDRALELWTDIEHGFPLISKKDVEMLVRRNVGFVDFRKCAGCHF